MHALLKLARGALASFSPLSPAVMAAQHAQQRTSVPSTVRPKLNLKHLRRRSTPKPAARGDAIQLSTLKSYHPEAALSTTSIWLDRKADLQKRTPYPATLDQPIVLSLQVTC